MSALLVVKAQLKGDLRRLSVSLAVTLAELRATLQKLYSIEDLARYTIKYTDDEGASRNATVVARPDPALHACTVNSFVDYQDCGRFSKELTR